MFNFALFHYNPIQTIAVDLEGKVAAFNLAKKKSGDRLPNIGDVMYKDYARSHEIDMYGELMKCIKSGEIKDFSEQKYRDKILSITMSPFPKGAVIISQEITERKRAEEERERLLERLHVGREQLRNLSHRLVELQEKERRNLSRELHDQIGQNITALGINLNIIRDSLPVGNAKMINTRLDDSQKLIEEMAMNIRDVMGRLRPPMLDDYGLMATLRWYGERFSKQTNMVVMIEGEELIPRLPVPMEIVLFRIVQESLINVAKHARAQKVTMTLEDIIGRVRLTIADDGIGFDLQVHYQSGALPTWGLINMRERAEAIGAHFHIETVPGKGTRVIVEVTRNK